MIADMFRVGAIPGRRNQNTAATSLVPTVVRRTARGTQAGAIALTAVVPPIADANVAPPHDDRRDSPAARRTHRRDPHPHHPALNYIVAIYLIIIGLAGLLPHLANPPGS
jgi:hypothetical protein